MSTQRILAEGYGAVTMIAAVIGMAAIAYVAWKAVNRQEQGDEEFQAKLKADDERAQQGLREESGLPPEPRK